MTRRKLQRVWLDPDFSKQLKVKAAKEGLSVAEFTKRAAEEEDSFLRTKDIGKKIKWPKI